MAYRDITVHELWTNQAIAAGTTLTSAALDIGSGAGQAGQFSLQIYVQGSGTSIHARYICSNDAVHYVYPRSASAIATGTLAFHHMSGASKDGRELVLFSPPTCARMKIELWEGVGTTGSTVTAQLAIF